MKLKRKSRIWRVLLTTILVLVVDFLVIASVVLVMSNYYIDQYIKNDVYVQQAKAEQSMDEIIYEIFVTHERIFTQQNISTITNSEDLKNDFSTIVESVPINALIFSKILFVNEHGVYMNTSESSDVFTSDINKVEASSNQVLYLRTITIDEHQQLIFGRNVINSSTPSESLGVVFYYLNDFLLLDIIDAVASDYAVSMIINNEGEVIISEDSKLNVKASIEREPSYAIVQINGKRTVRSITPLAKLESSYGLNWQLVSEISYYGLFSELTNLQIIISVVAVVTLVVSIFLAVMFGRRLRKPVEQLSTKMREYSPGETFYPTLEVKDDEIAQLEASYNQMIERINNLIAQNKEDGEVQRKLELDSLQQQINPHFLYNTLDTIAWMAKIQKESEIEKIVLSLAKFFRISLHKGDKFITVEEEIELVQHFVDIELIRFPNKFTIEYNLSDEVKQYQTLKIIIQPIVENAIKHGISSLERMGNIIINAFLEDGDIVYEIIDDGVGFTPQSDMFHKKEPYEQQKSGFGLFNVNERIKLEYGPEYGLKVESEPNEGTKITVRIEGRI